MQSQLSDVALIETRGRAALDVLLDIGGVSVKQTRNRSVGLFALADQIIKRLPWGHPIHS